MAASAFAARTLQRPHASEVAFFTTHRLAITRCASRFHWSIAMPRFLIRVGALEFTSNATTGSLAIVEALKHFTGATGKVSVKRLNLLHAP